MAHSKHLLRRLMSTLEGGSSSTDRRRARQTAPALDALEGRVVLSHLGGAHLARAARLAAHVAQPGASSSTTTTGTTTGTTTTTGSLVGGGCGQGGGAVQDAQLTADRQTLQTALNAALAGSTVTDAQRLALRTDLRAIASAGITVDRTALQTVADSLLAAIADGSYDANQATIQSAFTAAFTGTSGAALTTDQAALVSTAYADFVAVAQGLHLDTTELGTLATDRAAIQADLARLGISTSDGHGRSANLDLIISPGLGLGPGPGRRGHR